MTIHPRAVPDRDVGPPAGVRRAMPADAAACAVIVFDWLQATAWMSDGPDLAELTGMLTKGIPLREVWVIGDPVAGYLSLDPETAQIHGFYVAQPGQGLGKALLDRVRQGRDYLQLWTHWPNLGAHRFYHREGFVTVEQMSEGRGDGVAELRMEWRR